MWVKSQDKSAIVEIHKVRIKIINPHNEKDGYFLYANEEVSIGEFKTREDAELELDNIFGFIRGGHKAYEVKTL